MSAIKRFLESNQKTRKSVAVVGDSMIDEYYFINANRISPEFPIPVFLSDKSRPDIVRPGGAANVAHQFEHFNVATTLYSFADDYLDHTCQCFKFNCEFLDTESLQCPIKRRLYYHDFPLCRWDIEKPSYGSNHLSLRCGEKHLCKKCSADILVLSDYDKGFFGEDVSQWIFGTNQHRPVVVDPKKGPPSRWKGCTIFKPNSKEALDLTGETNIVKQLAILQQETEAQFVVITDGGNESHCMDRNGRDFVYTPRKTVNPNSVIGAGDCFVAMLALAYSHKMTIEECMEVAFEASTVYVQKKFNEPITPHELLSHDDHVFAKFIQPEALANRNFSLCFTNGCFDILHEAHINLLRYAKSTADKLVVALNTDESVRRLKGANRPINTLESRKYMLSMFEFVDFIVSFDQDTPLELINQIKPEVLVKGGDWKKEEVVGNEIVQDVRLFPYMEGKSTSSLIDKVRSL